MCNVPDPEGFGYVLDLLFCASLATLKPLALESVNIKYALIIFGRISSFWLYLLLDKSLRSHVGEWQDIYLCGKGSQSAWSTSYIINIHNIIVQSNSLFYLKMHAVLDSFGIRV